jgi:hypothetical protein
LKSGWQMSLVGPAAIAKDSELAKAMSLEWVLLFA